MLALIDNESDYSGSNDLDEDSKDESQHSFEHRSLSNQHQLSTSEI